jgi:hypothetical protein
MTALTINIFGFDLSIKHLTPFFRGFFASFIIIILSGNKCGAFGANNAAITYNLFHDHHSLA